MKAIMVTVRLWWFYLTYKGIKVAEIRKRFAKNFKGKIYEYVSKTNWKKDLMKIPEEEREFFKQFIGKVGLCFECDKVEEICYLDTLGVFATLNLGKSLMKRSCLTVDKMKTYLNGKSGTAIHITKLEIFDKPKDISEFNVMREYTNCGRCPHALDFGCSSNGWCGTIKPLTRAPESWCYIEI